LANCVIERKNHQTVCAQAYYVLTMALENCGFHPSHTIFGKTHVMEWEYYSNKLWWI